MSGLMDYIESILVRGDYPDTGGTMDTNTRTRNRTVDRLDSMAEEQALIDNSDMFMGLGSGRSLIKTAANTAVRPMEAVERYRNLGVPMSDSMKDLFSNYGDIIKREAFGTVPKKRLPTVRYVDELKDAYGVNYLPNKTFDFPNNIYVADKGRSPYAQQSTLLHEFDHTKWYDEGLYGDNQRMLMTRGVDDDLLKSKEWSELPSEINAQAKQIGHALDILGKQKPGQYNTEVVESLEDLVQNTRPFVDEFTKAYPDKLGNNILEGMDWLDNMKYRR